MHFPPTASCCNQVLFVHSTHEYGGAEKHLVELLCAFSGSGIDLSVLCLEEDFFTERLTRNKTIHVDIRRSTGLRCFWDWFQVLGDLRPDVVVFVNAVPWNFPWYTPVVAWLAGIPRRFSIAHLAPPPAPSGVEGWSLRSITRRMRRIRHLLGVRLSAFFYTATICVSEAIRDCLVVHYHFPANKVVAIHNGVSWSNFERCESGGLAVRSKVGIDSEEFLLVCIGRLSEQKAIDILLLAVAQVLRGGVRCKCIIVGDGPLRSQLSEQALALGLSGHVFFEGFQEDVRPYLQAANAFILTSHSEGLPLALLEAMASGLPCVVTNVGGNAEVLTHGVQGLVVAPGSVDEVADAISYLVTRPHECADMSRMARAKVRESFDLKDRMAEIKRVILT
jgi:glycosyltransferase involved in cell wall biosynthesis